jgi:trigger factor
MTESKTASVTQLEDNKVRLDVKVSGEAVKEGVEAKVDELKQKVRVPGFRPGKAPRRVIETQVGKDYLYMEALQDRLPHWYSQAVVDTDIRPIDQPEIDFEESLDEEKGFKFSATVQVRPEAKLGEYKGLEVPKREAEINEEQVEEQIEEMRGQFATLAAVEGRAAQEGDYAIIDFKGELMSGGDLPGGEAEDYMLEIGKGELLEDFETNVVGMNADERKQFAVTFPMDYGEESLRGQSVLFRVHLKEIKERELPPLDDDFAAEASEFDTLEEFRQGVRDQLQEQLQQQIDGEFRGRALDEASKNAEVTVPEPMIDEKAGEMLQSFERSIQQQGIDPQQYYQIAGVNPEEMKQRVRPDAEDTVKKELVLDAVARAEELEADEETVLHEIGHLAEESGRSPEHVTAAMRANGTYSMLEEEVVRQKALEVIAENAVPVEMPEEEQEEQVVDGEPEAVEDEAASAESFEETNEADEQEEGQK